MGRSTSGKSYVTDCDRICSFRLLTVRSARIQAAPISTDEQTAPQASLLATVEDAHGVSDVNHIAWCKLSPAKAAETLRRLEGGEEDDEDVDQGASGSPEEDPRWHGSENMFASAGDDGVVKVWTVSS